MRSTSRPTIFVTQRSPPNASPRGTMPSGSAGAIATKRAAQSTVCTRIAASSCVGRTLPPEETAAILLRDVFDLTNDEAAKAVGISTSVLRHHLARARKAMTVVFDGLCALVGKQGACWQCSGLRDALPGDKRGKPVAPLCAPGAGAEERLERRLKVAREARFGSRRLDSAGAEGDCLHAYIVRYMARSFD